MRWFVEVTSLGKAEKDSLYVDADSWQKALSTARTLRGENDPMSGFSIELLEEGCRAVDPVSRVSYEVVRAPEEGRPAPLRSVAPRTASSAPPPVAAAVPVTIPAAAPVPAAAIPAVPSVAQAAPQADGAPRRSLIPPRPAISAAATLMLGSGPAPAPQPAPAASVPPVAPSAPPLAERRVAPSAGSPLPSQVIFKREQDATDTLPLTYREYVYVVPPGSSEMAAATLVQAQLELVKASLDRAPAGKLVNLAVFDVTFTGKPPVPPLATLSWKDWRGVALVSFPRQPGRSPITIPMGAPIDGAARPVVAPAPAAPPFQPFEPAAAQPPALASQPLPALQPVAPQPAPQPLPALQPVAPAFQPPPATAFQPAPGPSAPAPSFAAAFTPAPPNFAPPPVAAPTGTPFAPPVQPAAPPAPSPFGSTAPAPFFTAAPQFPVPAPAPFETPAPPYGRPILSPVAPVVQPAQPMQPTAPSVRVRGDDLITDLFESMHELHFARDAVEGGDFCLQLALAKLPSRAGIVELYDIDRREFLVACARGEGVNRLLLRRFPETDPLLAAAMRRRQAVVINDPSPPEVATNERYLAVGGARSAIIAPMIIAGRFLGAIELLNPIDGEPFTESEGNAVMYIAEQLAEFVATRGVVTDPERISARAL